MKILSNDTSTRIKITERKTGNPKTQNDTKKTKIKKETHLIGIST